MRTVDITNLDIKVWTQNNYFPQGNYLRSLTQPEITKQITFEPTDIGYDMKLQVWNVLSTTLLLEEML